MPEVQVGGTLQSGTNQTNAMRNYGLLVKGSAVIYDSFEFEVPVEVARAVLKETKMGAFSYCGIWSTICDAEIGRYCSIAEGVCIGPGMHRIDTLTSSPALGSKSFDWHSTAIDAVDTSAYKPVQIGHDVWIGTRAIIMGGVSIGHGAVVGAGSIVTKDVAPYSIVAGVPATKIRDRFSEQTVNRLLQIEPWRYDLRAGYNNDHALFSRIDDRFLDTLQDNIYKGKLNLLSGKSFKVYPLPEDKWRVSSLTCDNL